MSHIDRKELARVLADIDQKMREAERLTAKRGDDETLLRASKELAELREQRGELERNLRLGQEDQPIKDSAQRYWFPAKRYGWGWGPPTTWQGWLVIVIWLAVLMPVTLWLAARNQAVPLLIFITGMIAVLTVIGYIKGEPPRWRWGGK